jgi:tetratricopeptide (TPR) repeat protein
MRLKGSTIGIVGALNAFPRRLAARELSRHGGQLRRGVTRRTGLVVFGRTLIERHSLAQIEARFDAATAAKARPISESGFLRALGLAAGPANATLTRQALIDQSGLAGRTIDLLSLFDAFESDAEPYSFRDLILARKYAGLVAGGADWLAIARSVHRSGPVASLTALSLHAEGSAAIYARRGETLSELDGQALLPLDPPDDALTDDIFWAAEAAEAEHQFGMAAGLYGRCLALDATDSVAAFNRANCLRADGDLDGAVHAYAQAIKVDPSFIEAWFNFGNLLKDRGQFEAARRHLAHAIKLDPDYADAVYNLATVEFSAGNLAAARRFWVRYLELDPLSGWSRTAMRGIQYVDLSTQHKNAG